MRTIAGLWAWRRNPLCRRTDRAEGWLSLCVALLIALGAPLAGLAGGLAAQARLLEIVREQHAHRHPARATTEHLLPARSAGSDAEQAPREEQFRVTAFWKGPDGITRTGTVDAGRPVRPGDRFRVWTDDDGRITSPPLPAATATSHAVVAGLVVGVLGGLALEAGRRLAVRQLMQRRYSRWDEEWARIGPDWGRAGSTS